MFFALAFYAPSITSGIAMSVVWLYFFSADTAWVKYEHLQAEVFDHILAMLGTFDLRVFQSPSGQDLQKIN